MAVVQNTTQQQGLATVDDAMKFLSIGRTKLYELVNAGHIERIKLGGASRFTWRSLHEFVDKLASGEIEV